MRCLWGSRKELGVAQIWVLALENSQQDNRDLSVSLESGQATSRFQAFVQCPRKGTAGSGGGPRMGFNLPTASGSPLMLSQCPPENKHNVERAASRSVQSQPHAGLLPTLTLQSAPLLWKCLCRRSASYCESEPLIKPQRTSYEILVPRR